MDQNWKPHTKSSKTNQLQTKAGKELSRITTVKLILWNAKVIQHTCYQKQKEKKIPL